MSRRAPTADGERARPLVLGSADDSMAALLRSVVENARRVTYAEGLSLLLYDHERD